MPPEDNTPDFDSMSPEEIMAWMEALAVRQGATEGIITDEASRPQVKEIDPTTVDIKDNYIPYGMSAEQWEKKQAEERAKKEAKKASSTPAPTPVASTPPPPAPEPTPQPVASSSSADETPDFDNMTPEQIMAGMEALAVRQGATEGIITDEASRPQVKEIDPTTVDIKDNYIPYGMSAEQWEKKQAEERAKKEAQKASKPQGKTPFTPPPPMDVPVSEDSPTQPASALDLGGDTGSADWLSDLASGTTAELPNEFPEFDLSNLGDNLPDLDLPNFDNLENLQLEGLSDLAGLADGNTDPIDWLSNLVNDGDHHPMPTPENPFDSLFDEKPSTPPADNTIEWLESLAKKQGVSDDELITRPQVEFELPDLELDPNYVESDSNPFDFDNVDNLDQAALDATDPAAWLDSLAESQNLKTTAQSATSDEITTESMLQKLNKGISDPNDVKGWMDKLLEEGAKRQVPDYISEDEEPLQANIPDWLIDQVGLPPEMGGATNQAPIEIDFDALIPAEELATGDMPDWLGEDLDISEQPEAVAGDMPDWLTDTLSEQSDSVQAIFENQASGSSPLSTEEIEVDMSDPWVEAFELERQVAMGLISDEEVIFSDEPIPLQEVIEDVLEDEPLPLGELENVPSWMDTSAPTKPVAVTTASSDDNLPDWLRETEGEAPIVADEPLPDWLSEAGIADTSDVPDWLLETVGEEEPVQVFTPPPAPAPVPAPQPPVVKQSPAPVPTGNINVAEVLGQARAKIQAGDVDNGLVGYEAIIRANTALDSVIGDLQALIKQDKHKTNASVYRVLGDGLMRQGQLQQALDIYRKALNLL